MQALTPTAIQWRFVLLSALRWLPFGVVSPLLVLIQQSRGLGLTMIGQLLALHGLVVLALELPTGGLADAIGRRRTLLAGAVCTTGSYAVLAIARTPAQFAAVMMLKAVGRALDSGSLEAWYVDTARAAEAAVRLRPAWHARGSPSRWRWRLAPSPVACCPASRLGSPPAAAP